MANANFQNNYVDISILNPNSRVVGYEFDVSGIAVSTVQNLVNSTQFPVTPNYSIDGKVVGLSTIDSSISKNTVPLLLCRIYYSALLDSQVCIANIVAIVNEDYEQVNTQIGAACASFSLVPFNDLCANAIPVDCGTTISGNTDNASNADQPAGCTVLPQAPGIWYSFQGTGEIITARLCSNSNYNNQLQVYVGACSNLTCVTGASGGCNQSATVNWFSVPASDYYIYVNGDGGATGSFDLELTCVDPCPNPIGLFATNIGETSADLGWNSSNINASYSLEVVPAGSTPGNGNNVIPIITGSVNAPTMLVAVTGLTGGVSYDFYVFENCGSNYFSDNVGPLSFTTPFGVPANDLCVNATSINCASVTNGATTFATSNDLPATINIIRRTKQLCQS